MNITKKTIIKDIIKFLSGVFFVTAGVSWWMYFNNISAPFMFGITMSPNFLGIRGFLHFTLFLLCLYFGFIKK
jgi:hypothetical protein